MSVRLDSHLVSLRLAESREKAKRLIMAGAVRVDGQVAAKPSEVVSPESQIDLQSPERYVSRGGYKLEKALEEFQLSVADAVCVDVGASTGGFTDCLLQHGAGRIHAVDVGKGQIHWQLRSDPRVIVHDRLNARNLQLIDLGEECDLATFDVSFISLTKVLPAVMAVIRTGGAGLALVKPQFEAGRGRVGRGGVVRDPAVHQEVLKRVTGFASEELRLRVIGVIPSPLLGPAGNREFFVGLRKP